MLGYTFVVLILEVLEVHELYYGNLAKNFPCDSEICFSLRWSFQNKKIKATTVKMKFQKFDSLNLLTELEKVVIPEIDQLKKMSR